MPTPTEIRLRREHKRLEVDFDDGKSFSLPAEYLRVESPSAEVQGHGPNERKTIPGNYAIRLLFDDLHDTGIYSWDLLYDLGSDQLKRWNTYLEALKAQGLSRDP